MQRAESCLAHSALAWWGMGGFGNLGPSASVRWDVRLLRGAIPVIITGLLVAACGSAGSETGVRPAAAPYPGSEARVGASGTDCSSVRIDPLAGAPSGLGFTAADGAAPVWSGRTGAVVATSATEGFSVQGRCVLAFSVSDGHRLWAWTDRGHPVVAGAIANGPVVVAATGNDVGTAPAAVFPVVNHLVGLSAATGRELWSRALPADGQSIPAVSAGSDVIVSLADGTVWGLNSRTGSTIWSDPPPASCHLAAPTPPIVGAAVVAGGGTPTVEYMCISPDGQPSRNDGMVAAINPANGAIAWRWQPGGLSLEYQSTVASSHGVVTVISSGKSGFNVANSQWDLGPTGYQSYEVIGIDQTRGRPLWTLSGVAADAGVYSGAGQLCVTSQFGMSCRDPRTGTRIWQWRPPVVPTDGPMPAMGNAVATASGLLYLIEPTPSAGRIDTGSTTQRSAPGTFRLAALNMADGKITLSIPLPAYYGGPDGVVVSPRSPPGVDAVTGSIALITPQNHETSITEAFKIK